MDIDLSDSLLFSKDRVAFQENQAKTFSILLRNGSLQATGSEQLQQTLDRALPIIQIVSGYDAVQPVTEGGTLGEKRTEEELNVHLRKALEQDLHGKKLFAMELKGKSETEEPVTVHYVFTGENDKQNLQLENAKKCLQYAVGAISDAREFFPFTERAQFTILVLPVAEQRKHDGQFSYSPLFTEVYDLFKRRGVADPGEENSLIICFPTQDSREYFVDAFSQPPDEYEGVETDYDKSLYIQIRHEVTHCIQQFGREGDSDFAGEGIAMLAESLHLNSNDVHAQVRKEDIDLDRINEVSKLRDFEGYSESEYVMYRVSQSLFRFIYDYFDNNADKFGQMMDLMRTPYTLSLADAFQQIYKQEFKSMLPMWQHELERSEYVKR